MPMNPEQEAFKMLKNYWEEDGVMNFPVDAEQIARKLNIEVNYSLDMPKEVSGMIYKLNSGDPVRVMINPQKPVSHQRFTIGHELGHYHQIEEAGLLSSEISFVENRDALSSTGKDPIERFANAFSAALLMPKGALLRFLKLGYDHKELCNIFGVSQEALNNRLNNLGI